MHHFKSSDGTMFNYSPDLSGDVEVLREDGELAAGFRRGRDTFEIPGSALVEFMRERDKDEPSRFQPGDKVQFYRPEYGVRWVGRLLSRAAHGESWHVEGQPGLCPERFMTLVGRPPGWGHDK